MVKKLRCTADNGDWIKAKPYGCDKEVVISSAEDGDERVIFLTPTDARKLRKQIKKALEAIEGVDGEAVPETSSPRFSVGDKVRIVGPLNFGEVSIEYPLGSMAVIDRIDMADTLSRYCIEGLWFPESSVAPA